MGRLTLAWLAVGLLAACGGADRREVPRNVILVSLDSLRADHLASYGYERVTSPTLDRMAADGVLFESAVAESSWTLPTHASMLTGTTMGVHGLAGEGKTAIPAGLPLLPELLADRGVRTHGVWSGPYLHPVFGFARGYPEGGYVGVGGETMFDAATEQREEELAMEAHRTVTSPEVVDRAIAFLEEAGEGPFFLFLHLFDIHYDYQPPEADWRRFDPDYDGSMTGVDFITDPAIRAGMDPGDLAHLLALYDGEILHTDRHVGRLVDAVERLGLLDETLVLVTSDHGDEFFEHGRKGHRRTLYEEVVRVPMIAYGAGVERGLRVPDVVRHVDVMPTVLDLLGAPVPDHVMGESFAPLLRGGRVAGERLAISRLMKPRYQVSVRGRTWKVIHDLSDEDARGRLFDLEADPGELDPVSEAAAEGVVGESLARIADLVRFEEELRARVGGDADAAELPARVEAQLRQLGYLR